HDHAVHPPPRDRAPAATGCGTAAQAPPARPEASRSCARPPTEAHPGKPRPSPAIPTGRTPARAAPSRPPVPAPTPPVNPTKPQPTSNPSPNHTGGNLTLQIQLQL